MSETQHRINSEVEATLSSLDGLSPASPRPFFYTRLQARMMRERPNLWEHISRIISRPSIAIASLCLIIFMNALIMLQEKETPSLADQPEQVFMEDYNDYNMAVNSFYEIESAEP